MSDDAQKKKASTMRVAAINLLILIGLLLGLEGAASLSLAISELTAWQSEKKNLAERLYTEYDPLLGWINRPNVSIDDMYGPGVSLKTNAQRFRNAQDTSPDVPKGKTRVVCSGDSFTFGYGVDNDHAWCNRLSTLDPTIETVNMGQGGYGVDQSFLWYQRDGIKLAHNVHIFAFLTIDFERMMSDRFLGYAKPILTVQDGKPVPMGVPVPRQSYADAMHFLNGLAAVKAARAVFAPKVGDAPAHAPQSAREVAVLTRAVFARLKALADEKGGKVLMVHLPEWRDYHDKTRDSFRAFLRAESVRDGFAHLDLVDVMRAMPAGEAQSLFIAEDIKGYFGSKGHYNEAGNRFVADKVMNALRLTSFVPPAAK